jgi:hypothetical protein
MSKVIKRITETEIIFILSGERIISQYIDTFIVNTPFEIILTNHFIQCSIAKNNKKIEACKCILEDLPHADILFNAVNALANKTEILFQFPLSFETNPDEQTMEYQWLDTHRSFFHSHR